MPYPDDFSNARYSDSFERQESARAAKNGSVAEAACGILARAQSELAALAEPPGSRTAEMIDDAVAWIDEQRASIRATAEREAQDL